MLVRLDQFEFDTESGELTQTGEDGTRDVQRLAPQPARLLAMLVEKRGELLTRDEIRDELWPDVHVDFDRGVNFCMRQIRSALGDSASKPRYVETLPRRGYRLRVEPRPTSVTPTPDGATSPRWPRGRRLAAGLLMTLAVVLVATVGGRGRDVAAPPLRVAIMPFRPPPGHDVPGDPTRIAEALLEQLTIAGDNGRRVGVLGPRSTAAYGDDQLRRMADELAVDYIVNGRFIETETGEELLGELIRTSDGAHVWVHRFNDLADVRTIARTVGDAVSRRLELPVPEEQH